MNTKLAKQLSVNVGSTVTLISTTMDNAFTTYNFEITGIFNLIDLVSWVERSTSDGSTSEYPGSKRTSSKVKAWSAIRNIF